MPPYLQRIVITSVSASDLQNYAVRVPLDGSQMLAHFWSHVSSTGQDIHFVDGDRTTEQPYWLESFDRSAKTAVAWVKVPLLQPAIPRTIYLVYGGSNSTQSDGTAVFELFDVKNLTAYWPMDEVSWAPNTAGEVKDVAGAHHGTPHGAASTSLNGKFGRAAAFPDLTTTSYIEFDASSDLSFGAPDSFTYEAWIWLDALLNLANGEVAIMGTRDDSTSGHVLRLWFNHGELSVVFNYAGLSSVTYSYALLPTTEAWHHVVATKTSSTITFYFDGQYLGEATRYVSNLSTSGGPTRVGAFDSSGTYLFKGLIDEVRVYRRALTATEVKTIYDNKLEKMGTVFNVRKFTVPAEPQVTFGS